MTTDIPGLRAQILANARIMLKPSPASILPTHVANGGSQTTLLPNSHFYGDLDVVVFGRESVYTAALMVGLIPAIEGATAPSPEAAIRKLFIATAEMLNMFIPKVGAHQRNIHGGGVFDEDLVSQEIQDAQKRT